MYWLHKHLLDIDTAAVCSSISAKNIIQCIFPRWNPWSSSLSFSDMQDNSLNKQEDKRHIWPLWMSTQLYAQVHQFDFEVDSGSGCKIIPLYICSSLFRDKKPQPPLVIISGYGDFSVKNLGLSTVTLLTGKQVWQKAVFQVIHTRGCLILGHGPLKK